MLFLRSNDSKTVSNHKLLIQILIPNNVNKQNLSEWLSFKMNSFSKVIRPF